ncbi:DNA-binding transcriptional regulator, MerR family [Modestobacter sp. DSM 44400]|uniref:heavy metal-responsive transcriptional regulator n=1 Tax=Modestobacter sp. DSM 44400 TaxID=1550230 RepID=UPI0008969253|nr:heavy metal-responsive transcriptional regulator [Modestobacter sp. DSM 44400]SDY78363.1 DNA-binding transcriptional regulator, MerR family [Modestobacter sp. DSM 44400]
MLIGELGDRVGVSTKTIRYYEGIGLLPQPRRSDNGYRAYGPEDEARLAFVKTAQQLGLSLEDIGQVLALRGAGTAPCEHVRGMLREQIRGIGRQLAQLRAMREELQTLEAAIDQIPAGEATVCRVIEHTRGPRQDLASAGSAVSSRRSG